MSLGFVFVTFVMLELVIGGLILISFAEKRSIKPPSLRDVRRGGLTGNHWRPTL